MIANNAPSRLGRILPRMAVNLSVAAMLVVCLLACTRADHKAAGPPEKITIALAPPPYTTLADLAEARGYFRQEGLAATIRFHTTGKAALDEVLAGTADLATVAEIPFMFAVMKGEKIAIIATIQTSNKNAALLARKDSGIAGPGDLRGKKIGVVPGTFSEFYLDTFLVMHGIAGKKVQVVDLRPEDMPAALARGDIDAISAFPPFLNLARKQLGDRGLAFQDEEIYTQTINIAARQDFLLHNPGKVRKLLMALLAAEEFAARSPEEAQKSVADFRQVDRALFDEMWAGNTFAVTLDQALLLALEDESRWAMNGGLTGATRIPNYLDFIHADGLASVKPAAVRILR